MKKILINQLKIESMERLTYDEKKKIVLRLRNEYKMSYRDIEKTTSIPKTTIHYWIKGRNEERPLNFSSLYRRLKDINPEDITDWGRLELIKEEIDRLLIGRK